MSNLVVRLRSPSLLLRAASIVTGLFCLGHMSGYPWVPGKTEAAAAVVTHMRDVSFAAEGATRTYWEFYLGFGLIVGAALGVLAFVLWWMAAQARDDARQLTFPIASILVFMLINGWLSYRYFFLLPALFAIVAALLLGAALLAARARHAASDSQRGGAGSAPAPDAKLASPT